MKLAVVDYRMGNIQSLCNALAFLGCEAVVTREREMLESADKIILPGVGAFDAAMANLDGFGLRDILNGIAAKGLTPIFGICVGMQILASSGTENGFCYGLGWIDASVEKITPKDNVTRVPHVGFNEVTLRPGNEDLQDAIPGSTDLYFVHSYHMVCRNQSDVVATVDYGGEELTVMVRRKNIWGAQFHPEKSQSNGLKILRKFLVS
jgi:glutamine amidotransferase